MYFTTTLPEMGSLLRFSGKYPYFLHNFAIFIGYALLMKRAGDRRRMQIGYFVALIALLMAAALALVLFA
jgi:hypothetical protein